MSEESLYLEPTEGINIVSDGEDYLIYKYHVDENGKKIVIGEMLLNKAQLVSIIDRFYQDVEINENLGQGYQQIKLL